MFARAYSGFPVELSGVGELHAAFLNESRTRGCWWGPGQEIRIHGPKKMGRSPFERFYSAGKGCWCEQEFSRVSIRKSEISSGIALPFSPAMVFIDEKVISRYCRASVEISRGN
jgi:hypothetical protein